MRANLRKLALVTTRDRLGHIVAMPAGGVRYGAFFHLVMFRKTGAVMRVP